VCVCVYGCFDNRVGDLLICARVFSLILFSVCIFILICCVFTSVKTTVTDKQLNCSK